MTSHTPRLFSPEKSTSALIYAQTDYSNLPYHSRYLLKIRLPRRLNFILSSCKFQNVTIATCLAPRVIATHVHKHVAAVESVMCSQPFDYDGVAGLQLHHPFIDCSCEFLRFYIIQGRRDFTMNKSNNSCRAQGFPMLKSHNNGRALGFSNAKSQ